MTASEGMMQRLGQDCGAGRARAVGCGARDAPRRVGPRSGAQHKARARKPATARSGRSRRRRCHGRGCGKGRADARSWWRRWRARTYRFSLLLGELCRWPLDASHRRDDLARAGTMVWARRWRQHQGSQTGRIKQTKRAKWMRPWPRERAGACEEARGTHVAFLKRCPLHLYEQAAIEPGAVGRGVGHEAAAVLGA